MFSVSPQIASVSSVLRMSALLLSLVMPYWLVIRNWMSVQMSLRCKMSTPMTGPRMLLHFGARCDPVQHRFVHLRGLRMSLRGQHDAGDQVSPDTPRCVGIALHWLGYDQGGDCDAANAARVHDGNCQVCDYHRN